MLEVSALLPRGFYHVRRCLVAVFWEHPGVTFQESQDLFCHMCAHSFLYAKINIEDCFCYKCWIFVFFFFFSGCLAHIITPPSFCYISNHVFKVSYELTYFVVVNKILTVYLILRVFFFLFSHFKPQMSKIYLFVGLKYID